MTDPDRDAIRQQIQQAADRQVTMAPLPNTCHLVGDTPTALLCICSLAAFLLSMGGCVTGCGLATDMRSDSMIILGLLATVLFFPFIFLPWVLLDRKRCSICGTHAHPKAIECPGCKRRIVPHP